jgi:uncharacterized protein YecT (DUF1311 family)
MVSVFLVAAGLMAAQPGPVELPRPAIECAEHLTDWRARRSCLRNLLSAAEDELAAAVRAAGEEAAMSDLDSGGQFGAERLLDTAQAAWSQYRDAECDRRGALMFISDQSREEIGLDCRISLTRARTRELREM